MIFPIRNQLRTPVWKGFQDTQNHSKTLGKATAHLCCHHLACRKPKCSWRTLDDISMYIYICIYIHIYIYTNQPFDKKILVGHENTSFNKHQQNKQSVDTASLGEFTINLLLLCRSCPQQVQQILQLHWPSDDFILFPMFMVAMSQFDGCNMIYK